MIGQTEKALNAILARELDGSGLSEPGWVLLKLAEAAGGRLGRQELVEQAQTAAKFDRQRTEAEIESLLWAHLLAAEGSEVVLTDDARGLQDRVSSNVDEITVRLWGDLSDADLATAGRLLATILGRANEELGYSI
ncbi:MAG TPA: hypothetical protein VJL81_16325 [Solirubrobacterales bacterium]|nr:hypothetical protein [Solirubrobacterales bacterium]